MDRQSHDVPQTVATEDEAARITAMVRDGWWLLLTVALLLLLLRTV